MLHVGAGRTFWDYNATVERYLIDDWMKPVTDCLSVLLDNYPGGFRSAPVPAACFRSPRAVLVYNGQNDIILGPALTVDTLEQLRWSGQRGWNAAKKSIWTNPADKTDVSGYVRAFANLTVCRGGSPLCAAFLIAICSQHVIVRDAGHMVKIARTPIFAPEPPPCAGSSGPATARL